MHLKHLFSEVVHLLMAIERVAGLVRLGGPASDLLAALPLEPLFGFEQFLVVIKPLLISRLRLLLFLKHIRFGEGVPVLLGGLVAGGLRLGVDLHDIDVVDLEVDVDVADVVDVGVLLHLGAVHVLIPTKLPPALMKAHFPLFLNIRERNRVPHDLLGVLFALLAKLPLPSRGAVPILRVALHGVERVFGPAVVLVETAAAVVVFGLMFGPLLPVLLKIHVFEVVLREPAAVPHVGVGRGVRIFAHRLMRTDI
jgi:hypothetical protein